MSNPQEQTTVEEAISQFYAGVQRDFSDVVDDVEGASYVSWPTTLSRAGRPLQRVVEFNGNQYLEIFGGVVVAVDTLTTEGVWRRTWLPVLDLKNQPISAQDLDVRTLSDSINRCRAKSAAAATGNSLSYYAKGMHAAQFVDEVGVYPDDDLSTVRPKAMEKRDKNGRLKAAYLGWPDALAAASITDTTFFWEVVHYDVPDMATGEVISMPYRHGPGGGFVVSVRVVYKGLEHIEHLPILGVATVQTKNGPKPMEHRPKLNPSSADWNASVMRCLAKAIAVHTGYGLSIYAKEDIETLLAGGPVVEQGVNAPQEAARAPEASSVAEAAAEAPAEVPAEAEASINTGLVTTVRRLVGETSTNEEVMLSFFKHPGPIEMVPEDILQKMIESLEAKKKRAEKARQG